MFLLAEDNLDLKHIQSTNCNPNSDCFINVTIGAHLDLTAFSSPEELMSLGLDRLKSALQALSMKCGGTLEERAKRLFSTKGVSMEDLQTAQNKKGRGGKSKGVDSAKRQKEIASLESQVIVFIEFIIFSKIGAYY